MNYICTASLLTSQMCPHSKNPAINEQPTKHFDEQKKIPETEIFRKRVKEKYVNKVDFHKCARNTFGGLFILIIDKRLVDFYDKAVFFVVSYLLSFLLWCLKFIYTNRFDKND